MNSTRLLLSLFLLSAPALAGGTRVLNVGTEKLKEGDFDGTSLDVVGSVRPGWSHVPVAVNGPQGVLRVHRMKDGALLLGTSPDGKIYRVKGKDVSLFAETGELAVTAFAEDDAGRVYAATLPGGKLLRLGAPGSKPELVASLKEVPNIFALQWSKGAFVAAGGAPAKIVRVTLSGQQTVLASPEDQSVVSLAASPDGRLFAGTSGKGKLFEVLAAGKARVLYDFTETEVKELIAESDGSLIVAANDYGSAAAPSELGVESSAIKKVLSSKRTGKGALYKLWPTGRIEKLMAHSDTTYTALSAQGDGRYCVGSGAEGRVYCANADHAVTLLADSPERQVSGLAFRDGVGAFVSSDPVVVHEFQSSAQQAPTWSSRVLDAGGVARFGRLSKESEGVTLETRTGNTDAPDEGWSAWESLAGDGAVRSPAGRYLQIKARFEKATGYARELRVYYTLPNGRAVLTLVSASVRQAEPKSDVAPKHEASAKLSWKTDNDDGDAIRYRPSFKREELTTWTPLLRGDEWTAKSELEWDTSLVPDGRYRVRVQASDAAVNSPGAGLQHEATSEAFTVDNSAPVLSSFVVAGTSIALVAADALSPLVRCEVVVDGRSESAVPVEPSDGIWDSTRESLRFDTSELLVGAGEHAAVVRVWDAAGNVVTRSAVVRK